MTYCQTLNAQAISERHWVLVSDVAASFGAQMPASLFYATPAYWTQFHMYADEQPQFTPNATYWLPISPTNAPARPAPAKPASMHLSLQGPADG